MNGDCEHEFLQLRPELPYRYCPKCGAVALCEPSVRTMPNREVQVTHVCYPETAAEFASAVFGVGDAEVSWDRVTVVSEIPITGN